MNKKQSAIFSLKKLLLFLVFSIAMLHSTFAQGDPDPQMVEVKMKDGSIIIGELLDDTVEDLLVRSKIMGEVTIMKSDIESYKKLNSKLLVNGVYWNPTPNPTRNIYGPTGYGLKKGEGYYQNFMIFLNQVSYGFSENFTLGVGFEIISILGGFGSGVPGFSVTPKFSFPIKEDEWNIGAGVLAIHVPGSDELFSAGIAYGVSTWGSRENNISLGLGFGIIDGGFSNRPVITLAGNRRVGRRFGLVTENWFVSADGELVMLISGGGRYIGERITWDFALVGASAEGEFVISPVPLVGVTIPFGTGWKD